MSYPLWLISCHEPIHIVNHNLLQKYNDSDKLIRVKLKSEREQNNNYICNNTVAECGKAKVSFFKNISTIKLKHQGTVSYQIL